MVCKPEWFLFYSRNTGMTQAQTQPVSIEQWVSSVTNFSSQYDSLRYIYLFLWPWSILYNAMQNKGKFEDIEEVIEGKKDNAKKCQKDK